MKPARNILRMGALVVALGLSGCVEIKNLEGTVKEEFGTTPTIVESNGALFGNESVKFGDPNYGLVLETEKGDYTIYVSDYKTKRVIALAKAIELGDRIRITYDSSTIIYKDGIGRTDSDTIEIIGKAEK